MIREIAIHNFKSIQDLELSLGRVNVFIGANGAGKSNILEALAMSSAAADHKLDSEFLASRGIRIPGDPRLMRAAFERQNVEQSIHATVRTDTGNEFTCSLTKDNNDPYSSWLNQTVDYDVKLIRNFIVSLSTLLGRAFPQELDENLCYEDEPSPADVNATLQRLESRIEQTHSELRGFLIYSPEYSRLRVFEDESQIQPLGIRGEGLFRLFKLQSLEPDSGWLETIREKLKMFDWFDDLSVPEGLSPTERRLEIRDRYLDDSLAYFDQKSSSEGFLFVLFYPCLLLSKDTPRFFAIDNVDTSLNPSLYTRLMIEIGRLTAEQEKQVIVITHNPAALDGLDLNDDEQRLFVVSRNKTGLTRVRRVPAPSPSNGAVPIRLSEAFVRGYLGGLPSAF